MKNVFSMLLALMLVFSLSSLLAAAGIPEEHGLAGKDFGQGVAGLARSEPGAVADHVAGNKAPELEEGPPVEEPPVDELPIEEPPEEEPPVEEPHGMPALHGMTGREFGQAVRELAHSAPGAVAAHVRAMHEAPVDDPEEESAEEMEPENGVAQESVGIPALHELYRRAFGQAVRMLAQTEPGAVAAHVRMMSA